MQPLTQQTPKPLLPVGGKPIIQHIIEDLASAGFNDLVINHAWLGEQVEQMFGNGSQFGARIEYSAEGEPLETAGGIIKALPLLGEDPFVIVNGDIWTDYSFSTLEKYSDMEQLAHLVMVDNPLHHPEGDYVLKTNCLSLKDSSHSKARALTYSGIAVLHPALFSNLPVQKLALAPLFVAAIKQKKISAEHHQGEWFDIGTVGRLQKLDDHLQ